MLQLLGRRDEDIFVSVSKKLGYPVVIRTMDEYTATAMWEDTNASLASQHTILRYFHSYFGTAFVIPEIKVRQLGKNHVVPVCANPPRLGAYSTDFLIMILIILLLLHTWL